MKPTAWMLLLIVSVLIISTLVPAHAGIKDDRAACEQVKKKIRVIESKMRGGYSASQGIRYEARLRELKEKRYKLCR
jgi:hypothetical protein